MKPEHFKPFNVEHAKAGAPYACRNGDEATVLKWDAKNDSFQLIGVRTFNGDEVPESWTISGDWSATDGTGTVDLVMLPLGYIDGKPVFVGDELIDPSGATFAPGPRDTGHLSGCRWPELAKVYPSTLMTHDEMWGAIRKVVPVQFSIGVTNLGAPYGVEDVTAAIANAALRHAIDNGYAATKEVYDQCSRDLGKAERLLEALGYRSAGNGEWEARDCAARDMAIAEAVRNACARKTNGAWASLSGTVAACAVWKRIQEEIDLAAIIATVPA